MPGAVHTESLALVTPQDMQAGGKPAFPVARLASPYLCPAFQGPLCHSRRGTARITTVG